MCWRAARIPSKPHKGIPDSTIPFPRVTSAALSGFVHRCDPQIPLGLRAVIALGSGSGRAAGAPEESVTPGALCPRPGRASRARCVTSTGSRGRPCQDIPRVSHGPAAPAAATSQPRPASCCPGAGSAACLPAALPGQRPGLREPSPPPLWLQPGDALGEAGARSPEPAPVL